MHFCPVEREDFPEGEFRVRDGVRWHEPPGGAPHVARLVAPSRREPPLTHRELPPDVERE